MTDASSASTATCVIVGAGAAGVSAAEALRSVGFAGRVVLIGAEPVPPYPHAALTNGYLRGGGSAVQVHDPQWYADQRVELRLGAAVAAIHRDERVVALADGATLGYDRLLLATGASPQPLALPGSELAGVHLLRTRAEADALRDVLRRGGRVAVVGGGWAGLEVAAAARYYGAAVTILTSAAAPLHDTLGPELGGVLADLHRGNGVEVRTGVGIRGVTAAGFAGSGTPSAGGVALADGTVVPARTVIVGDGAAPQTGLAAAAGLSVDDGILVDEQLRTADPAIWAAGECARATNAWLGAPVRVRHAAAAAEQGRCAGLSMAGAGGAGAGWQAVPYLRSVQYDTTFELWGALDGSADGAGGYDEVVLRGEDDGEDDETQESFLAFWLRGGEVVAAMAVNADATGVPELVRARRAADAGKLADPGVDLSSF